MIQVSWSENLYHNERVYNSLPTFMKRLLVYYQTADFEPVDEKIDRADLQIEQVCSISHVLRRLLFGKKPDAIPIDIFLVCLEEPGSEMVDFVTYITKHKPELPLIILSSSAEKTSLLKSLFKGLVHCVTELNHLNKALDTVAKSMIAL